MLWYNDGFMDLGANTDAAKRQQTMTIAKAQETFLVR